MDSSAAPMSPTEARRRVVSREHETPSQRIKREKAAERQRRKRERDRLQMPFHPPPPPQAPPPQQISPPPAPPLVVHVQSPQMVQPPPEQQQHHLSNPGPSDAPTPGPSYEPPPPPGFDPNNPPPGTLCAFFPQYFIANAVQAFPQCHPVLMPRNTPHLNTSLPRFRQTMKFVGNA